MLKKILVVLFIIIVIFVIAVLFGRNRFHKMVSKEVEKMFDKAGNPKPEKITEAGLARLPEPVQKYLRYTKTVGKDRIHTIRLKQSGKIRMKPDAAWMPFEAEQYYTVDKPAFIWKANVKMLPLIHISGRDKFENGKGNMFIKVLSLLTVVDANGPEMDQGALCRYLNEMMWFPSSFLSDYIKWETIDSHSVRASITSGGTSASALITFNDEGKMTNFVAERYMSSGDKFVKEIWSTPIEHYKEFSGYFLPKGGKAVWKLKSGDFCYIELNLTEIEFNVAKEYE